MKRFALKRISILSLLLLAVSVATAFIIKDKKIIQDRNGHLTNNSNQTSTNYTCRPPAGDVINCHDTQNQNGSSSGFFFSATGANTSADNANTTVGD